MNGRLADAGPLTKQALEVFIFKYFPARQQTETLLCASQNMLTVVLQPKHKITPTFSFFL